MNGKKLLGPVLTGTVGLAAVVSSIAIADPTKDDKFADQREVKLPPGWTEADMQACMIAGTPGKMHEHLAKGAGEWYGKATMWMVTGAEPVTSECTSTVTTIIDGRFTKIETTGQMPGMGPHNGLGIYGFDNVSQQFVASWIDNHNTVIGNGVGELFPDGKTLVWQFTYNCSLTRKPTVLREVETITGPNTKTLETFGTDPKSGKEFKMMRIEPQRKQGDARAQGTG
jgi:hypothetical protein